MRRPQACPGARSVVKSDVMRPFLLFLVTCLPLAAADYDLIIENARLVDGTGAPPFVGAVAVKDGRIAAVGTVAGSAGNRIDAGGRVLAPGFIDVHTHSENLAKIPDAENFLRMGVTTIVTGNCGNSRTDLAAFFEEIERTGTTLNVASLIGHNAVREAGMGGRFIRPPKPDELEAMKTLVDQAMEDGAVGLSTGLIYVPGTFAKTDEIVALAKVAAAHGGIYVSHMRHENVRIFDAIDEFLVIAREAKIPAQVSHLKLTGPTAWGQADKVIAKFDAARAEGLKITHDQYAYTASSTGLRQTIPDSALEGKREDFIARIEDPAKKAAIAATMKETLKRLGQKDYAYAVIAKFAADPSLNGKSIPEVAKILRRSDSLDDQIEVILELERRGGAGAVYHGMNEKDLVIFLKHPATMIASDGGPRLLGEDVPHPRSYGNNARFLARYVREQGVLTLEEAIRRMTSLPADTFGWNDRGRIAPGMAADLVVFDPATVADPASYADPHHYAAGISDVIVNGVPVIREGTLTGNRPGGALRRGK
jgi:N-acyl-D-amino-acid deacylase